MQDKSFKTECPWQKMWSHFLFYQNEPNVKRLLLDQYKSEHGLEDEKQANRLAYENTHKFIYFLKQGVAYFSSAQKSDLIVQPLLLYYGVTSLMKAVILLNDPFYPRKTTVLQHGLTTRKKKKLHYQLLLDEIKVQREGLLPLFSELVLHKTLPIYRKYKVADLLNMLPELQDSYEAITGERTMIPVRVVKQTDASWLLSFTQEDVSKIGLPFAALADICQTGLSQQEKIVHSDADHFTLLIESANELSFLNEHPQFKRDIRGMYYFYVKDQIHISNELIVFNMLSYLLGMLCRYDTELWGELIFSFSSSDTFLIEEFLQLSLRKFPNLILNQIYRQYMIYIR